MEKLLNEIKNYMDFLEEDFGLDISVCDTHEKLFPYMMQIAPYNSHKNFYCTYLKKEHKLQRECIRMQLMVRAKLSSADFFSGTCYTGMHEYVFKIEHDNEYLGFVSVSSLCANRKKSEHRVKRISEKYGFKYDELQKLYNITVKDENKNPAYYARLIKPLCRLVELLYIVVNRPAEKKNDNTIFNRILAYILENYNTQIAIDDIADALHYSRSYISHLFSAKRNQSIMFHVNDLRIQKAKELLRKTDFSITEIASQVGYNDSNYFASIFKKYAKITPRQYRRQNVTPQTPDA